MWNVVFDNIGGTKTEVRSRRKTTDRMSVDMDAIPIPPKDTIFVLHGEQFRCVNVITDYDCEEIIILGGRV